MLPTLCRAVFSVRFSSNSVRVARTCSCARVRARTLVYNKSTLRTQMGFMYQILDIKSKSKSDVGFTREERILSLMEEVKIGND